jgi:tetratricopeptide (TPR) repeat protein
VADPTQLRLLEEALVRLDAGDSVLRVRVLAALAEALYGVPAAAARREAMSQEAVAMARRVGDPAALASALAARHFTRGDSLDARLAMAAESGRIGRELRDHRRSLDSLAWLIGDLLELGDVAAVDRELESFARAADQVRMPFYHWAVTTLRASRALLAGRFDDGMRLATEARAILADDDPISIAEQIHAVQKVIVDDERDRLLDSEAALVLLASRIPEVPGWRCSLAALYAGLGRDGEARSLLGQPPPPTSPISRATSASLVRSRCWRVSWSLRDVRRARLLYDLLLPYAERSIVVGFGIACYGAAARYLALLAATLGRPDEAAQHFEDALAVNARMGARPFLAHTQGEYAELLAARGQSGDAARAAALREEARRTAAELGMARLGARLDREATAKPGPGDQAPAGSFRRKDGAWTVTFGGESFRLSDTKGVHYLVTLLRHPCEEFHALLLGAAPAEGVSEPEARGASQAGLRTDAPGDAGEHLDAKARDAYRRRLSELRAKRAEAEHSADTSHVGRVDHEIDMLTQELARAIGLGGRARRAGSATERARLNVTRALTTVLRKIASEHPALGEHLAATVRTGTFVSYTPDPRSPMRWDI